MVPVNVAEVAAGQFGWPPPPHRKIMTPPDTLFCPKCKWANNGFPDMFAYVAVKLIVGVVLLLLSISMWKVPVAGLAVGGTSLSPTSVAEKTSVLVAQAPTTTNKPAVIRAQIEMLLNLVVTVSSCEFVQCPN
jgi:hypothetical protein